MRPVQAAQGIPGCCYDASRLGVLLSLVAALLMVPSVPYALAQASPTPITDAGGIPIGAFSDYDGAVYSASDGVSSDGEDAYAYDAASHGYDGTGDPVAQRLGGVHESDVQVRPLRGTSGPSVASSGVISAPGSVARLSTPSSRALGANLEAAGMTRPAGSAAHHIVAGGSRRAEEARAVLARFGIDINAAENGAFLPLNRAAPNATGAAVHSTLHTNAYYSTVNDLLLSATSRGEALDALAYIRQSLLGGGL